MKDKVKLTLPQLRFHPSEFRVECNGETIACLPKEFALFRFLYEHANQAFSRAQLLDHVWGLEEPTDRTVDDHIYRLRKKLLPWKSWLRIETVRGYGYKLTVQKAPPPLTPLLHDREANEHFMRLIRKYHGFGMGKALQTLADHQAVLGLELSPFYAVYTRFVSGDFHWIADTDSLSFWEKSIYLLNLYAVIQFDAAQSLQFFRQAIKVKHLLTPEWQQEVEFNTIGLYWETEQIAEGKALLDRMQPFIFGMDSPSFQLIWYMYALYHAILTHEDENAKAFIAAAERLLADHPIQREKGLFTIVKGLWQYQRRERTLARGLLEEGVTILQETGFVPHLLSGVHHILHHLRKTACDEEALRNYEKLWRALGEQYRLPKLEQKIYPLLRSHLLILL